VSATGLPLSDGGTPRLRITLVLDGEVHDEFSGCTLPNGSTLDPSCPMWVNEQIEILKGEVVRPLSVEAKVLCGPPESVLELGVARFELEHARGHLHEQPVLKDGCDTGGRVSLYWEVGPWLTDGRKASCRGLLHLVTDAVHLVTDVLHLVPDAQPRDAPEDGVAAPSADAKQEGLGHAASTASVA
jgi:hypothetical protein